MIAISRAKEVLVYDEKTGIFKWAISYSPHARMGAIAGGKDARGYINIKIDKVLHKAHRLAWLFVHGEWPEGDIDHINGIKTDNRIANLRDATKSENLQNQFRPHSNNKSGLLGVSWSKGKRKWVAQINVNGTKTHIGYFSDPSSAHEAYMSKKREVHVLP